MFWLDDGVVDDEASAFDNLIRAAWTDEQRDRIEVSRAAQVERSLLVGRDERETLTASEVRRLVGDFPSQGGLLWRKGIVPASVRRVGVLLLLLRCWPDNDKATICFSE